MARQGQPVPPIFEGGVPMSNGNGHRPVEAPVYEQERHFSPGMVQDFGLRAIAEMDKLLVGEREAKEAMVAAMIMGENVLLIGAPGGGKTTLAGDSYRIISGVTSEHIAEIPPNADLTPQRLVGDEVRSAVEVKKDGKLYREDKVTAVDAILRPDTKVIYGNEINRTNPYVVNTLLEALENGMINTAAGSLYMRDLLYSPLTMNPSEAHQSTFRLPHAFASRIAIGAELGQQNPIEEEAMLDAVHDGFVPNPRGINPVVTEQMLKTMRAEYKGLAIPQHLRPRAKGMERAFVDVLMQMDNPKIVESLPRIAKQHIQLSKALAYLGGEQVVTEEQLVRATKLMVTGRLGALSSKAYAQIPGAVANIVN